MIFLEHLVITSPEKSIARPPASSHNNIPAATSQKFILFLIYASYLPSATNARFIDVDWVRRMPRISFDSEEKILKN